MTGPSLFWDHGTAYDLFVSLYALHQPGDIGLRASWAAGVRARLPEEARAVLEQAQHAIGVPFHWLYRLPEPKNATAVLGALQSIPPAERLRVLGLGPEWTPEARAAVEGVGERGAWDEADQQALLAIAQREEKHLDELPTPEKVAGVLDAWARAEAFGVDYLEALHAYQRVFFAEEEGRIGPALDRARARARRLAEALPLAELLEELSQGVRFEGPEQVAELVLAPSYWSTPLIFFGKVSARRDIWLFGARPPDASLVPGEMVPDALLQALKALSDPTRLRILYYLSGESLSPADLARRLRLRLPTVTHHLKTLRLAGLVRLTLGEGKVTKRYAVRPAAVDGTFAALQRFLARDGLESDEEAGVV
jgi:DNA-binding transcriptional ArsR family regulator